MRNIDKLNRQELVDVMKKRGFTLMYESADFSMMHFTNLNINTKYTVTVFVDKNQYIFNTVINHLLKLNSDIISDVLDEERFNEFDTYFYKTVVKLES